MGIATRWTFATRSTPQKHGIGEPNDMWERYQAAMSEEGRERRAGRLRLAAVLLLAALLILTVVAALSGAAVVCSAQQERSWDADFSGSISRAEFVAGLASVAWCGVGGDARRVKPSRRHIQSHRACLLGALMIAARRV